MKSKIIIMGAVVALSLGLLACAPAAKPVSVEVSCDDFYEQNHISRAVEVAAGDSFTVTLCSNPTTGFQWSEEAQVSDTTVLKQISHEYVAPDSELAGAAGQEIWKFEALKPGTTAISMEYSRPWEGGEKGAWTFNLTVVVK